MAMPDAMDTVAAIFAPGPPANLIVKVFEEAGEVANAWIGAQGTNPRKGQYAEMADVRKELLDVALTALVAYVGLGGISPMATLDTHAKIILARHKKEVV